MPKTTARELGPTGPRSEVIDGEMLGSDIADTLKRLRFADADDLQTR